MPDDIVEILDVSDEDQSEPVSQPETDEPSLRPVRRSQKTAAEAEASRERRRIGQLKAKQTRERNKRIREERERLALRQIIGRTALDEVDEEDLEDEYDDQYDEIQTVELPEKGHLFNHQVGKPKGRVAFGSRSKNLLSQYKPVLNSITNRDLKASRMELELKALMSHNKKLEKKLKAVERKQPQTIVQVQAPVEKPVEKPVSEAKRNLGAGLVDFFNR